MMELAPGAVTSVPHVDAAGLRKEPAIPFMIREQHHTLWKKLDATSCLVEGPPGSGKSTTVWFWLVKRVERTGENALWLHFNKIGFLVAVVIMRGGNGTLVFDPISTGDPLQDVDYAKKNIKVCVVDGVTQDNRKEAGKSWRVFGFNASIYLHCHMIWVSSQQLVVPRQELEAVNMEWHSCFSWTEDETISYASTFDDETRKQFIHDVVSGVPQERLLPGATVDFDQAVAIKMYFFGCSARWLFGMEMKKAMEDLELHLSKVQDAKLIQSGLAGARGVTAVNHIIAMYASDTTERLGVFKIASSFVMEKLSKDVGLETIRAMYSCHWVRENPSVHGFVFECDILTRLEKQKSLTLTHLDGSESTWMISKTVRLAEFFRRGMTSDRILVCPEKWNQPEFDGLYIYRDQESLHLVVWNASEAKLHSGSVSELVAMLESLSQRGVDPIYFASVRFLFLVPIDSLNDFEMPTASHQLLAQQQLSAWSFGGFEVFGVTPTG